MELEKREIYSRLGDSSRFEPLQIELATVTATSEIEDNLQRNSSIKGSNYDDRTYSTSPSTRKDAAVTLPLRSLFLASVVAAGIQFGWALQLSLLTPYIQTLGIGHAFSSFIWLCGPITGLLVQPCIGIWSDNCTSRWGRRRPFILTGSLMVSVAVSLIGFSADIGYLLGDSHEDCLVYKGVRQWAAGVFILGFWILDLANNTVQGPARALLADISGTGQRDAANAIFSLWMALGNILGFTTGAIGKWHKWFPFLTSKACCEACGNLKAAFLISVIFLAVCTILNLMCTKEMPFNSSEEVHRISESMGDVEDANVLLAKQGDVESESPIMVPVKFSHTNEALNDMEHSIINGVSQNGHHSELGNHYTSGRKSWEPTGNGLGSVVLNLLTGVRKLPSSMKMVLLVMAFCWLSWFPFFLFDTDWMGREIYHGNPQGDILEVSVYQRGVQVGSLGLLLNSVVLAVSSLLIDPMCRLMGSKHVWALSNFVVFICMAFTTIVTAAAVKVHYNGDQKIYVHPGWVKAGAVVIFTILGFPLAITYSVPYSLTAELTSDSGGGQGLAMGILNLAIVLPQMVVALGAGPWDALFGGGNEPAFALAAIFALVAAIIASKRLPRLSRHGYERTVVQSLG